MGAYVTSTDLERLAHYLEKVADLLPAVPDGVLEAAVLEDLIQKVEKFVSAAEAAIAEGS